MTLRIDKFGRVILPKPLRDRLGLTPDREIEAVEQPNGGVLLRLIDQAPSMVQINGFWAHQGTPDPGMNWDRVIDDVREDRARANFGLP